jgi:hypothetical protein
MQASEKPAQERTFFNFGPNTLIVDAGLLGRKRGFFVLAVDAITKDNSAMNTSAITPSPASQEITRCRRIGFVIYPDCDIVDACGPFDAFHYADYFLARFGRTNEPGYKCDILAATLARCAQVVESSSLRPTVSMT